MKKQKLDWFNIFFFTLTPLGAVMSLILYTYYCGVAAVDIVLFIALMVTSLLSISAGYHRFFSHRTYQCNRILQVFYLIFGAATLEMSALDWSADHRHHHRFVDKADDPYNVIKGFFWAHVGWLFHRKDAIPTFDHVTDLTANPLVMWQHRWFKYLGVGMCFGFPTLIGWCFGHPFGGLIWGGLVRMAAFHQVTFFINSAAHYFGSQPYSNKNSSRDHWILAFLTFGEGYHNFHHTFQGDYRNGCKWYHFDPSKWWIKAFSWLGWTWALAKMPEWVIMKAKMEMKFSKAQSLLDAHSIEESHLNVAGRLEVAREKVNAMLTHFCEVWREHQQWAYSARINAVNDRKIRADWARKIRNARRAAQKSIREYKRFLEELYEYSAQAVKRIAKSPLME